MVSPGTLTALTALADGSAAEYEPSIDETTGDVGYPEAQTHLDEGDPRAYDVLESLAKREILEKTFVEKVYICPGCDSEGMAYTTACGGCGSAYTIETELFEHLTCGHIAPREEFDTGYEEYVCPGCGVEIESFEEVERATRHVCQDCGSYFETPEHGLRCRACGEVYAPGDATERVLCRYSLTEGGNRWVEAQLTARDSVVSMLEERGFDAEVETTLRTETGDHRVHVYAEDILLDSRIVAAVHERPDETHASHLREVATAVGARPFLVTTLGSVEGGVEAVAEAADMRILSADGEGSLRNDYDVSDDPRPSQSLVQRIASAVRQP